MIGNCPECQETIRIPDGRAADLVRCPLCSAEYRLERVLDALPPVLELVGRASGGIGIQVDPGEDEAYLPPARSIESGAAPSRRYQPQKRKPVNAFAEILKVILGGVVAIPVGILCVWWFAGRAPFGIAETVSKYAPWIVPEKLRGGDRLEDEGEPVNRKRIDPNGSGKKEGSAVRIQPDRKLDETGSGGGVLGIQKSIADPVQGEEPDSSEQKFFPGKLEQGNPRKRFPPEGDANPVKKGSEPDGGNNGFSALDSNALDSTDRNSGRIPSTTGKSRVVPPGPDPPRKKD